MSKRRKDHTSEESGEALDMEHPVELVVESASEPEPSLDAHAPEIPSPSPNPAPTLPSVPMIVFLQLVGRRPDQMAGFRLWAQDKGPMTIPEWHTTYQAYLNRPVP